MVSKGEQRAIKLTPDEEVDKYRLFRGELPCSGCVEYRHKEGSDVYDYIDIWVPPLFLLAGRVLELMDSKGVTGWVEYPVCFKGRMAKQLREADFRGLSIVGRCGSVELVMAKPEAMPFSSSVTQETVPQRGLRFDSDGWDGSDLFCPIDWGCVFTTRRVKDIFEANEVTNVAFFPIESIGYSGLIW